jgi:hypothetical protein
MKNYSNSSMVIGIYCPKCDCSWNADLEKNAEIRHALALHVMPLYTAVL